MIVSREYIPFRKLIFCHDKGGELFTKLCQKAYPSYLWAEAYLMLSEYALYQREMDWAFHGIEKLIDGFRELDEKEPYETGYDLHDADTADILWQDETSMKLLLRTRKRGSNEIVGVIEVPLALEKP